MPITLKDVCYTYQQGTPFAKDALKDIDLVFQDHCFTAMIGKTGSGKSTLLQLLNGLRIPSSGVVSIQDFVIDISLVYKKNGQVDTKAMKKKQKAKLKGIKELRKKVGIVFQFPEYQLFEETVLKDVSYGPKNFNATEEEAQAAAKEALALVGIDESYYERNPFELSGGEKRRVAIAGILALKPEILILDEPTVGLDAGGERQLMTLIEKLYESGTSIILATHNMDVVLKYCHRAVVLDEGKIVHDSDPLELFQNAEYLKSSSLEPPKVFRFALELKEKGMPIRLENVKDTKTLAHEIALCLGGKE